MNFPDRHLGEHTVDAFESDPQLRRPPVARGPSGRKVLDVPYFHVVFTVPDAMLS